MNKQISLSVVVPALNEESNLEEAVRNMVDALNITCTEWEIIVVNDGSTDKTGEIAERLSANEPRIKVLHYEYPHGIGYCFREGILNAGKNALTWLPGDGENDPAEILKYLALLNQVDMVVPFVINKEVRSKSRRLFSKLYVGIVNLFFGTSFNYTNGNIIYRSTIFKNVKPESTGFLFQTESLIKATRAGFTFAEVPIKIKGRSSGRSKALTLKSFYNISREFIGLFLKIHFSNNK